MLNKRRIFLTGGTGSFGKAFVPLTLEKYPDCEIVIFSRDEMKQWEMQSLYLNDHRVQFIIGDVRDREKVINSMRGIDLVVHAAATKIVPTAESNPDECIKTNVLGALNIIDAVRQNGVKQGVALSTDKACNPINLYGASKLASDKIFVAANQSLDADQSPRLAVVRYGNVMGSRGSVIPFFLSLPADRVLPITDVSMTRFMITLQQGIELVWTAFEEMDGGEIFVKKIPSMNILDIAKAIRPKLEFEVIGVRAGEKLHEQMVSLEDARATWDYGDHFKIFPFSSGNNFERSKRNGVPVPKDFSYSSQTNDEWMSVETLRSWINSNYKVEV